MTVIADCAALPKGKKTAVSKVEKPQTSKFRPLDSALVSYFANRGITKQTLERNRVAQEHTWMPNQPNGTAIAFPYLRNGEVVNVKYRTMDKSFRQVKGAEKILYGLDDIVGQETIIIVEGESSSRHCNLLKASLAGIHVEEAMSCWLQHAKLVGYVLLTSN